MVVTRFFQQASPVVKGLMLISITSAVVVLHNVYYKPYTRRHRYDEAEMYANILINESSKQNDDDNENMRF